MRQKKSNLIYYIIAAVLVALVSFVVLMDVPMPVEHVEEVIK